MRLIQNIRKLKYVGYLNIWFQQKHIKISLIIDFNFVFKQELDIAIMV